MTHSERLQFAHEYVQRYADRLLSDQEKSEYVGNKTLGSSTGMALSILVPFNVVSMIQMRYDQAYYAPRCKRITMWTAIVSCIWVYGIKKQNELLDRLSAKYFGEMPDNQLVTYDRV